jgi:class 3 adenylate cyclase
VTGRDGGARVLDNETLAEFNPAVLGLGDISVPSREIDAIAAVFDLAGFTRFCNHVDPHLAVPRYLSAFLEWIFERVKIGLTERSYADRKALWAELPFMAKFLGDGVLLLWNTRSMDDARVCSIVTTLYDICYEYRHQFYKEMSLVVDSPPSILRCGLARGRVFSVGNGRDYIGHCINTASRLQKLSLLTFCFPSRGFNVQGYMRESHRHLFLPKRASIRGVGENELVWVLGDEFNRLPERFQGLFRDP